MQKIKNLLFVAIVATMVVACNNDYEHYVPKLPEVPTEAISFTEDELRVLTQMRNPGNRICIDEATDIALDALDFFGGGVFTRSGQPRTIAGVTALQSEPTIRMTTRSTDEGDIPVQMPDTVAFIFNFAGDEGFTIISADTRITSPVLAFVESGYLDVNEELDHPGLAIFLEGLEEYIEYSIIESEMLRRELLVGIMEKLGQNKDEDVTTRWEWWDDFCPNCWVPIEWCGCPPSPFVLVSEITENEIIPWTTVVHGPLLPVEWGQGFPFNHQVPLLCNNPDSPSLAGRAPAGCVATALSQIMAFHRHPTHLDNVFIDWNRLRNFTFTPKPRGHSGITGTQRTPLWDQRNRLNPEQIWFRDNVSFLMRRIGHHVKMNYGCTESGASMSNAIAFLRWVGYTSDNERDFNTVAVVASLNLNRPVLISGFSTRNTFLGITVSRRDGHAWVVDGHLRLHRVTTTTVRTYQCFGTHRLLIDSFTTPPIHQSTTFLHNDWGWDGSKNGFFVAGSFNSNETPVFGSGTRGNEGDFRYKIRVFTNIRR